MIQQTLVKLLLAPFSLLYGFGVSIRDFFYRSGVLKGVSFSIPVISVGNLSIGGAGKTPHIEYLIRLLKDYIYIATISRGYRRKTRGFQLVRPRNNAEQVGDEPLQFKRKFPDILVSVSESRTFAIPKILGLQPQTQTILLDDAFQHRSVEPGLNILLTEYQYPFTRDYLLPSGRLREWRSAYRRADFIVVSKCPAVLSAEDRQRMVDEIRPLKWQQIYFSYYDYQAPYYLFHPGQRLLLRADLDVLLICAIARTDYLLSYLEPRVRSVKVLEYEDHHYFTHFDLSNLKQAYERIEGKTKVILTTEKDAMRLELHRKYIIEHQLPIFALPIQVRFHGEDAQRFDRDVKEYLLGFRV
ncbi:MAG: tetraacyldisaccharide 4'-kinase [Bacteroidota bacterium]